MSNQSTGHFNIPCLDTMCLLTSPLLQKVWLLILHFSSFKMWWTSYIPPKHCARCTEQLQWDFISFLIFMLILMIQFFININPITRLWMSPSWNTLPIQWWQAAPILYCLSVARKFNWQKLEGRKKQTPLSCARKMRELIKILQALNEMRWMKYLDER